METIQPKPKRARLTPNKMWSKTEEKALLEFLMENSEVEKPSAQVYYKRFAEEKSTPVEWRLVRAKVRNMRICYNKAKAWEVSTGADSMDEDTVKSTLNKMCSFYDEFDEIFGSRFTDAAVIEDNMVTQDEVTQSSDRPTSHKGIYSRTAVADIMQYQAEAIKLKEKKIGQDLIIKEKEILIKDKELELREKELHLKGIEIKNQERFQILELEMKERLAMEEIELREQELNLKENEIKIQERFKILELEMKERLAMEELKLKYK